MKAQQYREMSPDELEQRLEELQKRKFELKSQSVTEKVENAKALRDIRRDIARVKTILHERQTAKQ